MGKHLTPTQNRLLEGASVTGKINVRTLRVRRDQMEPGQLMNQYELVQLRELEKMQKVKILRLISWGSSLGKCETHVAKLVG